MSLCFNKNLEKIISLWTWVIGESFEFISFEFRDRKYIFLWIQKKIFQNWILNPIRNGKYSHKWNLCNIAWKSILRWIRSKMISFIFCIIHIPVTTDGSASVIVTCVSFRSSFVCSQWQEFKHLKKTWIYRLNSKSLKENTVSWFGAKYAVYIIFSYTFFGTGKNFPKSKVALKVKRWK